MIKKKLGKHIASAFLLLVFGILAVVVCFVLTILFASWILRIRNRKSRLYRTVITKIWRSSDRNE